MSPYRLIMSAAAATLLSTAAFATPPSASQVAVPQQAEMERHGKMQRWFNSPDQFRMFRIEMHQATHGLPRDQKRAYRKAQVQKIRAMNDAERDAWRRDLQAKWDAMPAAQRQQIAAKLDAHAARYHARRGQGAPDQGPSGQGATGDYSDQGPPPPPHQ